ncbi:DDHD-domain-containing protein [Basidiobolus meristosporus CBS 931.73]|uniref:DDHD-domain-containing protein n=1 Tax=Basidiobolus meristosporus CBS 931.73 TaxID=1314790 RepID=A0A1Y1ZCA9_9FUNG|nr:DDHD-domain-containing protein [Basidiobolus meristosporus CBS 931.73]|eukprot:ORY07856.1 DDHD-domain-containing protein [Basidiobolus meristosporus CBS 931.73]
MYQTEGESFKTNQQRADVDHVLFVIHGIGPIAGENHFEENVKTLRKTIEELIHAEENKETFNIEVIAIEWRSALHDVVDQRMQRITLKTCPTFRSIGNDYLADVMYYFTNHNGQHIINTIVTALNDEYDGFMKRYPDFKGSFSLLGYSLGGVCSYDILCAQDENYNIEGRKLYAVDVPKLKFSPRHLFTLGSPIGAVMVQRSQEYEGYKVPKDCTFHNIFDPYDPIAYRIEPLIDERYAEIEPLTIESYTENSSIFRTPFSFPSLPSGLSGIRLSFSLPSIIPALSNSGSDSDKEEEGDVADDANATELKVLDIDALCEKFREERPKIQLSYDSSWSTEELDPEKILEGVKSTTYLEANVEGPEVTTDTTSRTELVNSESQNDRVEITSTATFEDRIRTFKTENDKTRVTEEVNTTQARCEAVFTEKDGTKVKNVSEQSDLDRKKARSSAQSETSSQNGLPEDQREKPKTGPELEANAEEVRNDDMKPKQVSKEELRKLQEGHRVDRVLQEGLVTSEYIAAMTAHFNYWTNKDAVYYILKQLINEISHDETEQKVQEDTQQA